MQRNTVKIKYSLLQATDYDNNNSVDAIIIKSILGFNPKKKERNFFFPVSCAVMMILWNIQFTALKVGILSIMHVVLKCVYAEKGGINRNF